MFRYCTLRAIFVQYRIDISLPYIGLNSDFPGAHSVIEIGGDGPTNPKGGEGGFCGR